MIRAGLLLLAIFFDLATCILISAGIALLWPGTPFDVIWLLKPDRWSLLMPNRFWFGPTFLVMTVPAAFAAYGFFRLKSWARLLAIAIFAANGVGDAVQMIRGHLWDGALGVTIAGLLVLFLTSAGVRAAFQHQSTDASL